MGISEQILKEVYFKHRIALVAFANSILNNPNDAEEVVNDVFIQLWENETSFLKATNQRSFLYKMVKNRSLNQIRKSKIEWNEIDTERTDYYLPTFEIEREQTEKRIEFIISKLPTKCRQIFLMSRFDDLSHKEIAELMDVSPKTVENQIGIALKFLKNNLFPSPNKK